MAMERNAMSNDQQQQSYLQTIATMRQERSQRERLNQLENIQVDYREAVRERDAAAARGDLDEFELRDTDCERLEADWRHLNPQRPPQADPRMVEFVKRRAPFVERHGQAAIQAMDMAHRYVTTPRNPNATPASIRNGQSGMGLQPNTPQYFEAMDNLLTMYSKDYGLRYDPEELLLTPNEAARISGVSANQYNDALRQVAAQGRLGADKK
jgi:hypothetical protein